MKKALSLVEVLVSIIIITIVVASLVQTNIQSLKVIDKFENENIKNSTKEIVSLTAILEDKEKKYYVSDLVKFKEDEIDRKLKEIKFEVDIEKNSTENIKENTPYPLSLNPKIITIKNDEITKEISVIEFGI